MLDFGNVRYRTDGATIYRDADQQLCTQAIAVKTSEEVERVVGGLSSALELHIRLAKESLETQVSTISALNSRTDMPR